MRTPGANGYNMLATPGEFSVWPMLTLFQWHYTTKLSLHFLPLYSRAQSWSVYPGNSSYLVFLGPNLTLICTYNISRVEEVIITYAICSSCQKTSHLTHTLFIVLQLLLTEHYARHWWYVMNTTQSCLPPSDFFLTMLVSSVSAHAVSLSDSIFHFHFVYFYISAQIAPSLTEHPFYVSLCYIQPQS